MFVQLGNVENILSIQMSVLTIKSMSFILKDNKIDKLTLRCKTLETQMGKVIEELIDNSTEIDLKPHIIDNKVVYFYVDTYEKNIA